MSINRKNSKVTLRLAPEDLAASLDQKNSIIASLQNQLQKLRTNQDTIDRVKEQLYKRRSRYECLLRDQEATVANNGERLELSVRNIQELRIQSDHTAEELLSKTQMLREMKSMTQELIQFSNKKEDQATERTIKLEEQKSIGEVLRGQEERLRLQIGQLRQEVEKTRREYGAARTQNDMINQKCFKTQSYIRSLLREEANLSESLIRIENENSKLNDSISELDTLISINEQSISDKEKDCQELDFAIANKELEKKKIQNEGREKVKQLAGQKEKWRLLWEQWEQKKQEEKRLDVHLAEATAEISLILSRNKQIMEVNEQLGNDLRVCQKHQENVFRTNKNMEAEILSLKETSLKAISKLQEPFSNLSNQPFPNTSAKWNTSSRATNFQTGQFS